MVDLGSPKVPAKATPVAGTKKVEEAERDQTGEESNRKRQRLKPARKPTSVTTEKLQESREKIRDLAWGKESTKKQADRNRRIYEEAMKDMGILKAN